MTDNKQKSETQYTFKAVCTQAKNDGFKQEVNLAKQFIKAVSETEHPILARPDLKTADGFSIPAHLITANANTLNALKGEYLRALNNSDVVAIKTLKAVTETYGQELFYSGEAPASNVA